MELIPYLFFLSFWLTPLLVFRLSHRRPRHGNFLWILGLTLTSWVGLGAFVVIHYWIPELRKGPPSSWRAA